MPGDTPTLAPSITRSPVPSWNPAKTGSGHPGSSQSCSAPSPFSPFSSSDTSWNPKCVVPPLHRPRERPHKRPRGPQLTQPRPEIASTEAAILPSHVTSRSLRSLFGQRATGETEHARVVYRRLRAEAAVNQACKTARRAERSRSRVRNRKATPPPICSSAEPEGRVDGSWGSFCEEGDAVEVPGLSEPNSKSG